MFIKYTVSWIIFLWVLKIGPLFIIIQHWDWNSMFFMCYEQYRINHSSSPLNLKTIHKSSSFSCFVIKLNLSYSIESQCSVELGGWYSYKVIWTGGLLSLIHQGQLAIVITSLHTEHNCLFLLLEKYIWGVGIFFFLREVR